MTNMKTIFAAEPLGTIGGEGLGPYAKASGSNPLVNVTSAISSIIGFLTVIAAIWFLFQLVIGGIGWMSASGEAKKITEARERITNAFIGLIIVVAAWGVLALAGQFFGVDFTIPDPGAMLNTFTFH